MCTSNSPSFKVRDSRLPGHFWADNEIIRDYGKQVGVYGFSAYMLLCYLARPSIVQIPLREIAALLDFSFGKLSQTLDALEGLGLIQIDRETSPLTITLAALKCSPHEHDVHSMNTGVHHMNTQYNKEVIHKTNTLPPDGGGNVDNRYPLFVEDLQKYWQHSNSIPFSFGSPDGRAVKAFLKANPKLTRPSFQNILQNRTRSERVAHSEPIHRWLGSCLKYASGALDAYGKPKASGRDGMEAFEDADTVIARMKGKTNARD